MIITFFNCIILCKINEILSWSSSGIIWETRKSLGGRWRALNAKEVNAIEEGYQRYIRELQIGKSDADYRIMLEPKLMVK